MFERKHMVILSVVVAVMIVAFLLFFVVWM